MAALVIIRFTVPSGQYQIGDYCQLHGDDGSGTIDWDNPLDDRKFELFEDGGGYHGWGHMPWGHGTSVIEIDVLIEVCGTFKYGLKAYDELDNEHVGQAEIEVHISPAQPIGLKKNYNSATNVLILDVNE